MFYLSLLAGGVHIRLVSLRSCIELRLYRLDETFRDLLQQLHVSFQLRSGSAIALSLTRFRLKLDIALLGLPHSLLS